MLVFLCEWTTGDGLFQKWWWKVLMMDLFLINMQLFASQDVNWWTGVMLIICGPWCFYQLMAPIHCREHWWASEAMLNLQIYSDEETNSSTFGWHDSEYFHFWANYSLMYSFNHSLNVLITLFGFYQCWRLPNEANIREKSIMISMYYVWNTRIEFLPIVYLTDGKQVIIRLERS